MLVNLLPGLRELRTPLAAGYVWLIGLWIAFGDAVPRERPQQGPLAMIWDAAGWLGASALLGAVSFCAYLIGSFFAVDVQSGLPARIARLIPRLSARPLLGRLPAWTRRPPSDQELRLRGRIAALADAAERQGWDRPDEAALMTEITAESRTLATLLLKKNERLFDQYDRLQAEGDYRINLALPLSVLSTLLAATWHPLLGAGILAALIIAYQGTIRLQRARDVLITAVQTDEIDTAGLAELKEQAAAPSPDRVERGSTGTREGPIVHLSNGKSVLPNGKTVPSQHVMRQDHFRADNSVVPVGSLRLADGRVLTPPWTGEPEPPQILYLKDGRELHPDGREFLRDFRPPAPAGAPPRPSVRAALDDQRLARDPQETIPEQTGHSESPAPH